MPFELVENTIRRLPSDRLSKFFGTGDSNKGAETVTEGDHTYTRDRRLLTDDVVNWSKDLGDEGIFMYNVWDGPIFRMGNDNDPAHGSTDDNVPINEFISQPGFTKKVKFIEGNTGDFDINDPYKYAYQYFIKQYNYT